MFHLTRTIGASSPEAVLFLLLWMRRPCTVWAAFVIPALLKMRVQVNQAEIKDANDNGRSYTNQILKLWLRTITELLMALRGLALEGQVPLDRLCHLLPHLMISNGLLSSAVILVLPQNYNFVFVSTILNVSEFLLRW